MSSTLVNAGKRLMATDKSRVAAFNGGLGRGYSPCHRVGGRQNWSKENLKEHLFRKLTLLTCKRATPGFYARVDQAGSFGVTKTKLVTLFHHDEATC